MIEESKVEKLLNDVYQYEDIKKFNIIFKEASKNEALKKQLLSFIDKNEEKLYYTLVNAPINNELLSEIREMFKLTKRSEMLGNTLKHYDVNVRIYMLRELGKSKTDVFLNWYIEAMQDEHWEVKKELAIIFSNHNSKDTLNLLVSFLDDSDKRVANEAIDLLAIKGEAIFDYIEKYVNMPMIRLKLNILELLNKIESFKKLRYLLILSKDNKEKIKVEAQQSIFILLEKIDVNETNDDIENVLEYLEEELSRNDIKKISILIKMLLKFKEIGASKIVQDVINKNSTRDIYFKLLNEIKNNEKIYIIMEMLNSKIPEIKEMGIKLLKNFKVENVFFNEVEKSLGKYIVENKNFFHQKEKNAIISFIISNNLLEKNIEKLNSDISIERKYAVEIIGMIEEAKIYKLIINMRKDPDISVRLSVIEVLASKSNENFLNVYEEMLDDPDENIQKKALESISNIDTEEANLVLHNAMTHTNINIRNQVSMLLARDTISKYISSFDKLDVKNKKKIALVLEKMDGDIESLFLKKMKSIDANERKKIIEIIEYVENQSKYKEAILVAMKDPESTIRAKIANILKNIKDKDVLLGMLKLLNDPDKRVRANIIETFGKINNKTAIKLIIPYLEDMDNRVKANSIIGLYHMGYIDALNNLNEMLFSDSEKMRASGIYIIRELKLYDKIQLVSNMTSDKSELVKVNLIKLFYEAGEIARIKVFLKDINGKVFETAKEYLNKGSD